MVKHTQTIRLSFQTILATNCLSVFDHFVGLELKELTSDILQGPKYASVLKVNDKIIKLTN